MSVPDYQALMLPILRVAASTDEVRTGGLVERMADEFRLSAADRDLLVPSGQKTMIADRTHWAITYLSQAGLLKRVRRGFVSITPRRREVMATNPERIDNALLATFPEFLEFKSRRRVRATSSDETVPANAASAPDESATPADRMRVAQDEAITLLSAQLLDLIMANKPKFFEQLVVRLLSAMGFGALNGGAAEAIGRSGDGGLDDVIEQDVLGLDRVYIQAKRYGADRIVGPSDVRDFFGGLDIAKAAKGVFITTSTFSTGARETADRLGKRIVLIDGDRLAALMIRYDVGVRIEETFHITKIDEDFFLEA